MRAVALDVDVDAGAVTELDWQSDNLLEILIGLFARKLSDALRKGMARRYISVGEDMPALRGQFNVVRQFTTLAASPHILACRYDALSPDIALNQIMKAAVRRLLRLSCLAENQRLLRELDFIYADIADVSVKSLPWGDVVIDRTNILWKQLLSLAKLLLGDRFQSTSTGSAAGFALLFEMNTLFERYIAKMLARVLAGTNRTVHAQGGRLYCLRSLPDGRELFMTKPDVLIKSAGNVEMVIDTKWKRLYRLAEDPKRGVSHADVYQMMAYGRVYRCPSLLLLYPRHAALADASAVQHRIVDGDEILTAATVDITSARSVADDLRELISPRTPSVTSQSHP
jgi:5-methylcytosine-specific restriction enzyme subunit McrC